MVYQREKLVFKCPKIYYKEKEIFQTKKCTCMIVLKK